ncbi:MAG TPA: hypothetical protein VMV61_11005, partial [Patescibacteria group bacterium]|nr:hypothetical protein [Patescibacteria group bacterium]
VGLEAYEHSLKIDAEDASRVRVHHDDDGPTFAAEEDRARRKKAWEEAQKVRAIYEEMVLKKTPESLVQIGGPTHGIAPAPAPAAKKAAAGELVAGD